MYLHIDHASQTSVIATIAATSGRGSPMKSSGRLNPWAVTHTAPAIKESRQHKARHGQSSNYVESLTEAYETCRTDEYAFVEDVTLRP